MSYIGAQPPKGQYRKLRNFEASFDGILTSFQLEVDPGGAAYYVIPGSANQLIVSLGGVIQEPNVDYTVSSSQITFTTAPAGGLNCFIIQCGDALNTGVPGDGTVTDAKLGSDLTIDLALGSAATPSLTFDSNTGIFSPGADQVGIATNGAEAARVDSSGRLLVGTTTATGSPILQVAGDLAFNSGYGSVAVAYGCRAWVNFDGTGAVPIRASGNVSSITDNGTADYTVNFTTAMVDTSYSICGAAGLNTTSLKVVCQPYNLSPPATGSVRIQVPNADGIMTNDSVYVSVAIFR